MRLTTGPAIRYEVTFTSCQAGYIAPLIAETRRLIVSHRTAITKLGSM
jgi:hypothetical protein